MAFRFSKDTFSDVVLDKSIHDDDLFGAPAPAAAGPSGLTFSTASRRPNPYSPETRYRLSPAFNKSISIIANQISRAKWRFYTANGNEIGSGRIIDLFNRPTPGMSMQSLLAELVSWWDIRGEMAFVSEPDIDKSGGILPLNPNMLTLREPIRPKHRGEVATWHYVFKNGKPQTIADLMIGFEANFNTDPHSIRGLPPALTCGTQADSGIRAWNYNRDFFQNGAMPSALVNLGATARKSDVDSFRREFSEDYGHYAGNSHKIMVTKGSDKVSIDPLSQEFDGEFLKFMMQADDAIYAFYNVPGILQASSLNKSSRYDTSAEELEIFLEMTLLPRMQRITELFQRDLIDRHLQFTNFQRKNNKREGGDGSPTPRLTKALEATLEKAGGRNIVALLDPDTLPIMSKVMQLRAKSVGEVRANLGLSFTEAADWVGIDIPHRVERDDIYVPNNQFNISDLKKNEKLIPGVAPKPEAAKPAAKKAVVAEPVVEQKPEIPRKVRKAFAREMRALTLTKAASDEMWSLADGDAVAEKHGVPAVEVRSLFLKLRGAADPREFFRTYDPCK
jgi:HK97 family phage portal protein